MSIKKGDFIEIEFVGRLKDDNKIFDLTDEKLAKDNDIYNEEVEYGPIVICIGEKNVLKGLDKELEGKEVGKTYNFDIKPEDAFGKKDLKLIKIVNANIFKRSDIRPYPGLRVNIEGIMGTVRTVSGGRINIDFNHPLAGKELVYEVKILKKIEDPKEKINACLKFTGLKSELFKIEDKKDNKYDIEIKKEKLPEPIKKAFEEKIKQLIPEIKEISIKTTK